MAKKYTTTQYEKESGALVLLEYGRSIAKADNHRWGLTEDNAEKRRIINELREQQSALRYFYEITNKQAVLKKYITENDSDEIDLILTTIIAYMSYRLTVDSDENILLSVIANTVSHCLSGCSPLEIRRYVASILVHGNGAIQICEDKDNGKTPRIFLGDEFIREFYGDESAIITPATILERQLEVIKNTSKKWKNINPKRIVGHCSVKEVVKKLPDYTPQELSEALEKEQGYTGQEAGRKKICLTICRFMQRLRKIHLEGINPVEMPRINNSLIRGSTGTGKTYLLECIGKLVTGLNVVIIDICQFSETGYVGREVETILTEALQKVEMNVPVFENLSIICLDEIDKLSNASGRALVSRDGVVRGLLKMLENTRMDIPLSTADIFGRCRRVSVSTGNLLWFGLGAFANWNDMIGKPATLGFGKGDNRDEHVAGADSYNQAGFGEELLGRLGNVVEFKPLNREEMAIILKRNTIPRYEKECAFNGIQLSIHDDVYDLVITEALKRKTGARGLTSSLETHLSEALFSAYSDRDAKEIKLIVDGDKIQAVVKAGGKKVEVEPVVPAEELQICAGSYAL